MEAKDEPDAPDSSAFFGVDLAAGPRVDWATPRTREQLMADLEEGARLILEAPTPVPCGFPGNAHLTAPRPSFGNVWRCVNCGDLLVMVKDGMCRPADLPDFPEGTTLEDAMAISFVSKGGATP